MSEFFLEFEPKRKREHGNRVLDACAGYCGRVMDALPDCCGGEWECLEDCGLWTADTLGKARDCGAEVDALFVCDEYAELLVLDFEDGDNDSGRQGFSSRQALGDEGSVISAYPCRATHPAGLLK